MIHFLVLWLFRCNFFLNSCCCCLPCNNCSNYTWVVEEILAFSNRLRSTHCREILYMKLCMPAYYVITTQLLFITSPWPWVFMLVKIKRAPIKVISLDPNKCFWGSGSTHHLTEKNQKIYLRTIYIFFCLSGR